MDLHVGSPVARLVGDRLRGHEVHVPAHFDAEVLSALGCLQSAGHLTARQVATRLRHLAEAPMQRHTLQPLLAGAWSVRHNVRLVDALYVELARRLDAPIITTDAGLAAAARSAEHLGANG